MSKKRSLGSSPIGFKSDDSSMGFIPDLGVSKSKKHKDRNSTSSEEQVVNNDSQEQAEEEPSNKQEKSKKKIVSYNLEVDLIDRVKTIAGEKDMYYSSLVSLALKRWIAEHS